MGQPSFDKHLSKVCDEPVTGLSTRKTVVNKAETTPSRALYVSGRYKHVSCGDRRKDKQAEDGGMDGEWGGHTRIPW